MAGQSDVEAALVALIANALYPQGNAMPSAVQAAFGPVNCRIYRGSPGAAALDSDLVQSILNVSVFALPDCMRNVTRYPRIWQQINLAPCTLTVITTPDSASYGGFCVAGELAGIAVNGVPFVYAVQANDTPSTVASNITALIRQAGILVQYAGATVRVPGARSFVARAVSGAQALLELKRQVQEFKISLWCSDPMIRDAATPVIDQALSLLQFIALADGSSGRLIFNRSLTIDSNEEASLYRQDLIYEVEYPTTQGIIEPAMLFGNIGLTADGIFAADYPTS